MLSAATGYHGANQPLTVPDMHAEWLPPCQSMVMLAGLNINVRMRVCKACTWPCETGNTLPSFASLHSLHYMLVLVVHALSGS